jgi:hypothetical protein
MKRLIVLLGLAVCVSCGDGSSSDGCEEAGCEDDGNECTVAECNAETGLCETVPVLDATSCADGTGECAEGQCVARCNSDECDDDNECTSDFCDLSVGRCDSRPVLQPIPCDFDGAAGICDEGQCIDAGACDDAVQKCDDGNECTTDRCNPTNGECSHSTATADGVVCDAGAGVCASGSCEVAPQTKRYLTTCTDLLYDNSADIPIDLTVDPAGFYTAGEANTGFTASFRLDQGLGDVLVGLGIDSTEITALEVQVEVSGATAPATVDLPSAMQPPFTLDFTSTDTVDTGTVTQDVVPDGVASTVDFVVGDWMIGIVFENMGVPINTSLSPNGADPIFSCGPLVPAGGSIRYPQ